MCKAVWKKCLEHLDRALGGVLPWAALAGFLLGAPVRAEPVIPGLERLGEVASAKEVKMILIAELNCGACHRGAHVEGSGKPAPNLEGVGARLQAEWLRRFLSDPADAQPGSTMPDVLGEKPSLERERTVEALLHFLVSQKGDWEAPRLAKYSDPHHGGRLFRRMGCLACHSDPMGDTSEEAVRPDLVSLTHVREKYAYTSLTDFLHRPLAHRPGGRMPDFGLEFQEAADIAAYLLDTLDLTANEERAVLKPFAVDPDRAREGRKRFGTVGCAQCHALEGTVSTMEAPPGFELLARLSADQSCVRADYDLNDNQRDFLRSPVDDLDEAARMRHRLATWNCYACHERDGVGGPLRFREGVFTGDETLGNEGRFSPSLTAVGRKFQREWLLGVLQGDDRHRLRPYLHTRMPFFGEESVSLFAEGFWKADRGDSAPYDPGEPLVGGKVEAGRILLGTEGGVGCITCHALGERRGLTLRALTLSGATRRYTPQWFRENLIHPARTRPGTLMPSFWPNGEAGNREIVGGDTERQIASIWSYLESLGDASEGGPAWPPGYPDFDPGAFEIVPRSRPVIQRTFMEGVGTHAIAVGFPEGVHLAFDAEHCRLALAWRGRFLDAYQAWFSRLQPTAEPLGHDIRRFPLPEKPASEKARPRFGGYELDENGVPTFLYRVEDRRYRCRWTPNEEGGLNRELTIVGADGEKTMSRVEVAW